MLKFGYGVPEAVLCPRSAGLVPGSASKSLMLSEWAAGPGAVLFREVPGAVLRN